MKVEILNNEEEYKRIHELVFNRTDIRVPPVVIVGRNNDGNIVAFVSGFWNSDDSFYIQYSGVLPEYQKGGYLRYLVSIFDPHVTYDAAIENTNAIALKTALSVGFLPIGIIYQENKLFVQLKREKNV